MEHKLIEKIKAYSQRLLPESLKKNLVTGIGDDCAEIVPFTNKNILITTDTFLEDVHFRLEFYTPYLLGKKLASINLSDIAAMGASPMYALLNCEIPKQLVTDAFLDHFLKGLIDRLYEFDAILIGGDTVSKTEKCLGLTLTLIGAAPRDKIIHRFGAKEGDFIYTSGFLGDSALGFYILEKKTRHIPIPIKRYLIKRHIDPFPQIALGKLLAEIGVNSLIDVSDGIATDLAHICKESGVMAEIFIDLLPISRALKVVAKKVGKDCLDFALFGGEDYELIWTIEPQRAKEMEAKVCTLLKKRPIKIGKIAKGRGVIAIYPNGQKKDISFMGYEH